MIVPAPTHAANGAAVVITKSTGHVRVGPSHGQVP
jgi:hypothetical protein